MNKNIPMTLQGFEKLQHKLYRLKNIERPKIIKAIKDARSHGDLKENAEYKAAREEQSFCEGQIQNIEIKLSKSYVIDITKIKNNGKVVFGSTVIINNIKTNKNITYKIVGDDEANLKEQLISINAPLARALIGNKINTIISVNTPKGIIKYKILNIKFL
ncbi:transcription elongation factor GreA [Enterobacteriaceae endosymbiont of Neohaemonia nigricornis]|uniref:transcription elongation factor GreA n=1 Tax=Enterobacteriaceae endosymbiont of Neohaemonia nigricornis TaxID=2675792 RepID=UPI0014498772|nr:transcription elongation factor GreA [Enterobacteriaceae endosymbiont of Neohaemonia nigricornis]QJC30219.1 transcription elongation factor GreA [Enterobacteriaceae endosymbiont of Neohaemonia nigricornis]